MLNRRHFMSHVAGASAMALPALSFMQNLHAQADKLKKESKSLIILWMGGGPTHMDLWDVKDPGLPNTGEFKRIKTSASGVEVSEILTETAKQMKHLSIVRSLVTNEGSHERGTEKMLIGRNPTPVVPFPHIGSVMASQAASKDLKLPPFISVGNTSSRVNNGQPSGFLGMAYAPFSVQNPGQPPANIGLPGSLLAGSDPRMAAERMRRRQRLFYNVEDTFAEGSLPHLKTPADREAAGSPAQAHATTYGKAFDLTVSPLAKVFEVRGEPSSVIDAYGGMNNRFGMGCLLARKLVEKGVSCVEVDLGGWDNHANIFNALRGTAANPGHGVRLDKGMSALVADLVDRGLWKNTVVVWMGEFGRTPRINQNGGRDHWGTCWSVAVGGGAIKGGMIHGSTTKDGMSVDKDPASIGDLFATIFKGLGIDPGTKVRDNLGRPIEIADGKPISTLV
jgi:hypothetical protein